MTEIESEERFRAVIQNTTSVILVLSPDHKILEFNNEAERLYGRKCEEVLGRDYFELFLPREVWGPVSSDIEKVLAGGVTRGFENSVKTADRGERRFSWSVGRILDASGHPGGIVAIGQDITERVRLDEDRKTILDTAMDGFYLLDSRARFLDANDAYCQLLGYSREELLGMGIENVEAIESAEEVAEHVRQVKEAGAARFESRQRRKDGNIIDVEISVQYMENTDRLFAFARDIAERKQAEIELRRNRNQLEIRVEERTAELSQLHAEQRNIADTLQETFLTVPEEIGGLDFGHLYRGATEVARVGGDFFDLFELEGNKVGILVGDVSGKGLEAAKMTSMIKNTIRAYAHEKESPAEVLRMTNKSACRTIQSGSFATVFLGILDTTTGGLTYCNAGHPPSIVRRTTGRSAYLVTGNGPVGILEEFNYDDRKIRLKDDDVLFTYTDGLVEARHDTQFYGEKRLRKALKELASIPAPELPRAIFDRVLAFANGKLIDDIAILSVSPKRKRGSLEQIADQISAAQTREEVLNILSDGLTKSMDVSGVGIFLIDQEKSQIYGATAWPKESEEIIRKVRISLEEPTSVAASVARTGSVVVVDDAVNDPRSQKWLVSLYGSRSFLAAPISIEEKVMGVLIVGETRRIRHFTDDEVRKVQYLVSNAGEAIKRLEDKSEPGVDC